MEDRRFPLKLFFIVFAVITVGFAAEFYYDFTHAVYPAGFKSADGQSLAGQPVQMKDLVLTPAMVRSVTSPFGRAYNNIIALLLTFIALAIPITANLYTPKLIEIFLKDRINLIVLCAYGILASHSVLAMTLSFDAFAGRTSFWIACFGAMLGWAGLIPYYYYVLQFLNPATIIARVTDNLLAEFRTIARGVDDVPAAQRRLNQRIVHLGSVILKAVERADRDVSIDSIRALVRVLQTFAQLKPKVAPRFFAVDQDIFTGMARAAIEIVNQERVWVEQKCLTQLALAYNAALAKMPDAVSAISDAVKDYAHDMARAKERQVLDLAVRFLNTFIRESIKKKDVHAIYDVFYQYKSLARKLMPTHPDVVREMAVHFKYYADMAKMSGMPFIYELTSYEIAELAEAAHEQKTAPPDRSILQTVLSFEGVESSPRLVKSRAILGGYYLEKGLADELERIVRSLDRVPAPVLEQARRELLETTDRVFWEVTDRQVNFDYVDDARKARVKELFEKLLAARAAAPSAAPAAEAKRA